MLTPLLKCDGKKETTKLKLFKLPFSAKTYNKQKNQNNKFMFIWNSFMVYYNNYRGLFFCRVTKKLHALIIKQNRTKKRYQGFRVTISKKRNKKNCQKIISAYIQLHQKNIQHNTILLQITVINCKQNQFVIVALHMYFRFFSKTKNA